MEVFEGKSVFKVLRQATVTLFSCLIFIKETWKFPEALVIVINWNICTWSVIIASRLLWLNFDCPPPPAGPLISLSKWMNGTNGWKCKILWNANVFRQLTTVYSVSLFSHLKAHSLPDIDNCLFSKLIFTPEGPLLAGYWPLSIQ